jgi:hypothetical protein
MDLTISYTFYPMALPQSIAWVLFVVAVAGGIAGGVVVASMIITFFVHDL